MSAVEVHLAREIATLAPKTLGHSDICTKKWFTNSLKDWSARYPRYTSYHDALCAPCLRESLFSG